MEALLQVSLLCRERLCPAGTEPLPLTPLPVSSWALVGLAELDPCISPCISASLVAPASLGGPHGVVIPGM